ncbi:vomeronasal type-1 receptor 4-like [Peromyscus californicus insignis]|uniref:vomeronasal type-1 receptor 4-like n=1 Tax=Peromyscus californicus insignis TaxID=564181 RepID=UPI0022A747FA|nr:vomeronasal type-1 receptor 4-like [Peromyscus californicus insignis]
MTDSELSVRVVILSLTIIGFLGNSLLLYHYLFLYLARYRLRSTDWVLMHLIVANILTVLFKGVPHTMAAFGLTDFLNDTGCKLVFSFHRISRGVCIGSTCFLSVFQAIIISSRDYKYSELKINSHKYICYSVYLNWAIHFLISSINLVHMRAKYGNDSTANLKSYLYCYSVRHDQTSDFLYAALLSAPDILFLGLMLWASVSMVITLYKHKQRMQQMPRANISSRFSPESRASKTILLLVSTFVSFYTLSSVCQLFGALMYIPSWSLVHVTAMASLFFPTVCPFLLMSRDSSISSYCLPLKMNRHFPKVSDQELN